MAVERHNRARKGDAFHSPTVAERDPSPSRLSFSFLSLTPTTTTLPPPPPKKKEIHDRKDIFFSQSEEGRFVPRALLVDLEPRVVAAALADPDVGRLFCAASQRYVSPGGGGAGNGVP